MNEQLSIPLGDSDPVVDVTRVSPTGQELPPINGRTRAARHASYTGAVHAQKDRTANIAKLRALWCQPHTLNDMAALSGLPLSSVCSLKKAIEDDLEFVNYQMIEWGEGKKPTRRSRWRVKP